MSNKVLIQAFNTSSNLAASTTFYQPLATGANIVGNTTEANSQITYRTTGTMRNLGCLVLVNDRAASTLRLRVNGANGNQSVSISGTGSFEDTTNSDAITAGDEVNCSITIGAGGATFNLNGIAAKFSATDLGITVTRLASVDTIGSNTWTTDSVNRYAQLCGTLNGAISSETAEKYDINTAGTWKNLFVHVNANARTSTTTVTGRLNGADTALILSITAGATGFVEDTTHSVAIAADDDLNYEIATGTGSGEAISISTISSEIETTNRKFPLFLGSSGASSVSSALTRYGAIAGQVSLNATEANVSNAAKVNMIMRNMTVYISANTLNDTTTVRTRKNTGNGAMSIAIATTLTGLFEDAVNVDTIKYNDQINYSIVTAGSSGSLSFRQLGVMTQSAALSDPIGPGIIPSLR